MTWLSPRSGSDRQGEIWSRMAPQRGMVEGGGGTANRLSEPRTSTPTATSSTDESPHGRRGSPRHVVARRTSG
jgi:hypothetical protein